MKKCGSLVILALGSVLIAGFALALAGAQQKEIVWSADEKPLHDQIHGLRDLPDDVRARTTRDLALKIRQLPATENKLPGRLSGWPVCRPRAISAMTRCRRSRRRWRRR